MSERARGFAGLLLALACGSVAAQGMSDPTAPLAATAERRTGEAPKPWTLQSTLVSDGRRIAVINDRVAAIGDVVDGARVVAISHGRAELDSDGRRIILTLFGTASEHETTRGNR